MLTPTVPRPVQQRLKLGGSGREVTAHRETHGPLGFFCVERGATLFYSLVYLRAERVAECVWAQKRKIDLASLPPTPEIDGNLDYLERPHLPPPYTEIQIVDKAHLWHSCNFTSWKLRQQDYDLEVSLGST